MDTQGHLSTGSALDRLNTWIAASDLSQLVQTVPWVIPNMQTVHILAISVVISSMAMLDLRLLGLTNRRLSIEELSRRFMPWMWCALLVLLLTGVVLIIGEPKRSLGNWVFQLKMLLLLSAVGINVNYQRLLKRNAVRLPALSRNPIPTSIGVSNIAAKLTGALSLLLWLGIIVCGRWIAYVTAG